MVIGGFIFVLYNNAIDLYMLILISMPNLLILISKMNIYELLHINTEYSFFLV